jgi:hypothetical protein
MRDLLPPWEDTTIVELLWVKIERSLGSVKFYRPEAQGVVEGLIGEPLTSPTLLSHPSARPNGERRGTTPNRKPQF